jgi:hypothetical protein
MYLGAGYNFLHFTLSPQTLLSNMVYADDDESLADAEVW